MSLITSLFVLAVLCASAFADPVQSGYIIRVDYTDQGCMTAFRNTTFLINACAPPSPVLYTFDSTTNTVTQNYYNGDKTCSPSNAVPATFQVNTCISSPIAPYMFAYVETFPDLMDGVYTYTVFDPSMPDCTGQVLSVEQELDICFNNSYGSYQSNTVSCTGTQLTVTSCTDVNCMVACQPAVSTADPSKCDSPNHAISSCNAPQTTAGGATVATTGKTTASGTTSGATGKGSTASGTTGSGSGSDTGSGTNSGSGSGATSSNPDSTTSSSASAVAASVVLASVSYMLLL